MMIFRKMMMMIAVYQVACLLHRGSSGWSWWLFSRWWSDAFQNLKYIIFSSWLNRTVTNFQQKVIWSFLVEDSNLFLKYFMEKLTRDKQVLLIIAIIIGLFIDFKCFRTRCSKSSGPWSVSLLSSHIKWVISSSEAFLGSWAGNFPQGKLHRAIDNNYVDA